MMLNVISQEYCRFALCEGKLSFFIESGGPQKRLEHLKYLFQMCVWGGWGVCVCTRAGTWQATFVLPSSSLSNWGPRGRRPWRVERGLILLILLPIPAIPIPIPDRSGVSSGRQP